MARCMSDPLSPYQLAVVEKTHRGLNEGKCMLSTAFLIFSLVGNYAGKAEAKVELAF
jgi:hypothetical protein